MFHCISGGRWPFLPALTLLAAIVPSPTRAQDIAEAAPTGVQDVIAAQAVNPAGDLHLGMLLEQAVTSHPSIAAAQAIIRAAGTDIRTARWQAFPSFSIQGLWLDQRAGSQQVSLIVDQPVWTGGRISSSIRRAKAQHRAMIAAYQATVLDVMVNVSQSYREYHRLDRKSAILQESLARHRELVETMERRVNQEISPLADLELARSRTAQIEQQVATTAAQRLSALQKLRELVGDPGADPGSPPASGPLAHFDTDELVKRTLAFDPGRQRLMSEADAAQAEAASTRAAILPQLSAQYSYDETYGHRAGLVLKAQSSGGLSSITNAAAARQRQEAAELGVAATERNLRERTVSDIAEYDSARNRMASTRTARDAAENVTQSYMRQFVSGRRTWLDVMNAVREATTAESDAVDAAASASEARDRLLMRSGSWPFPVQDRDMQ